ncbi:MAG TPA: class I SAM-dependent methyltransferase [Edaphobacter sp.]|jgi:SAM-dependent methyltransferase|nr:class I SAM-dependent methyltransferase [Edaphobacter sp.]
MDVQAHWELVYATKDAAEVSWFRPHLERSLELIERAAPDRRASILDIGSGQSTLVDDLLSRGYEKMTALEISKVALDRLKERIGPSGQRVQWICGDVTEAALPEGAFDVWHDRAVFHFLTEANRRRAYAERVEKTLKPGGSLILSTFGPSGPDRCSGLATMRYDPAALAVEFGNHLRLVESSLEMHRTPMGTEQEFLTCWFRLR